MNSLSVIHDVSNLSNHEPIILEAELVVNCISMISSRRTQRHRVSWAKAKDGHLQNHRDTLSNRLKSVVLPVAALTCQNMRCGNTDHRHGLDE
jgi:hypothetical protein